MYHHHRSRQCPISLQYRVLRHRAPRWRVQSLKQSDPSLQYRAAHCRIGRWQERSRSPILTHRHRLYPTITHANLLIRVPSHHGMTSFKWCIPSGCTDRLPPHSLAESNDIPPEPVRRIQRKPTMTRPPSVPSFPRTMTDGVRLSSGLNSYVSSCSPDVQVSSPTIPQAMTNGPIQYPQIARTVVPHSSGSSFNGSVGNYGLVSPPQASLHPALSRRRSEYHDQSQEALALTGAGFRASIDYPDLSSQHILRPPPIAAAPKERPRNHAHTISLQPPPPPPPPTIPSEYPVTYWSDVQIGTMGLKNLGNTCYMNSTIQCLSATVPFARFFTGELSALFVV